MKKVVFFAAAVVFAAGCFAKEAESKGTTYKDLSEKAISSKKIKIKEYNCGSILERTVAETVSKANMEEDLDALGYLLENCYAGYEESVSKGFDFEKYKADVLGKFQKEDSVKITDFIREMGSELLFIYEKDCDFYFSQNGNKVFFHGNRDVRFANIFVRKSDSEYVVVESQEAEVKTGQKYTGNPENLFYYPVKGNDVYRVGDSFQRLHSASDQYFLKTSFDNSDVEIKCSLTLQDNIKWKAEFSFEETPFSGYVRITSLARFDDDRKVLENLDKFWRSGYWYQNRTNCILDLRTVVNGRSEQAVWFLTNLYISQVVMTNQESYNRYSNILLKKLSHLNDESEVVYSPLTTLAKYRYLNVNSYDQQEINNAKKLYGSFKKNSCRLVVKGNPELDAKEVKGKLADPFFKGKLIILVDGRSEKCVEETCAYAKELFGDQVVICGTSTSGNVGYSNVYEYQLPASGIVVGIPSAKVSLMNHLPEWKGSNYGIYPDVWSTDEDMNETVVAITGDEALRGKF